MKNKLAFFAILYIGTVLFSLILENTIKLNQTFNLIVLGIPLYYILIQRYKLKYKQANGYIEVLNSCIVHSLGASVGKEMVFVQLARQIQKSFSTVISEKLAKGMGFNLFFLAPVTAIKFANITKFQEKKLILVSWISALILNYLIYKQFKHSVQLSNLFLIGLIPVFAIAGHLFGKHLNKLILSLKQAKLSLFHKIVMIIILTTILWLVPETRNYGFPGEFKFTELIPPISIVGLKLLVTFGFIALMFPSGYFTPILLSINLIGYYILGLFGLNNQFVIIMSFTFAFSAVMTTFDNKNYTIPVTFDTILFIIISKIYKGDI